MKYKRVYEEKFRDSATAVDEVKLIGFTYKGRRGLFKKYDQYIGLDISHRSSDLMVIDSLEARLYSDGHLELYVDSSTSTLEGMSKLPSTVYSSVENYQHELHAFQEAKAILRDDHGNKFTLQWLGSRKCGVYPTEIHNSSAHKVISKECLIHFTDWRKAFEWAAAESKK